MVLGECPLDGGQCVGPLRGRLGKGGRPWRATGGRVTLVRLNTGGVWCCFKVWMDRPESREVVIVIYEVVLLSSCRQ